MSLAVFGAAMVMATSLTGAAAAVSPLPCVDVNVSGDVSGFSSGCQVLNGASNDQPKTLVAEQGAFGISDWVFAGKQEFGKSETAIDTGFSLGKKSSGAGGTWSIDPVVWDTYPSVLMLFKSANTKQATAVGSLGNVVMFLLQPGQSYGEYARSLGKHDVSHISLYVSRTDPFGSAIGEAPPSSVPLPAAAWMLLTGLAGMGLVRRRRSRAA